MDYPFLSEQLVRQVEKCDTYYIGGRIEALQAEPGNPYGAELAQFGSATAMLIQALPSNPVFNRVADLSQENVPQLDEIVAWYRQNKVKCRFDLVPSQTSPQLFRELANRGFYQSGFYATLYGVAQTAPYSFTGVKVRPAKPTELDEWCQIYVEGHGFPQQSRDVLSLSIRKLYGRDEIKFYFGLVDEKLAAVGLLLVKDGIGYLATAATLPQFRNRGCQKALLQERINEARQAGCELVVSHTSFLSNSQHNMEKTGLRLAYTKSIWTQLQ